MAHYMVVSNNQYPWKDILSGCFIQIVEAGTAIEAVNKVKQGIDYVRAYAVGQVHPHFNSCDGAGIGITPFAPVPDFPDFEFEDVWKAYQLRYDAIRKKIEFEQVAELIPSFYKRRTKEHQVGDIKSIERHTKKTELTKVLTWLARYGKNETVYWLESKIPIVDESKQKFYRDGTVVFEQIDEVAQCSCPFGSLLVYDIRVFLVFHM